MVIRRTRNLRVIIEMQSSCVTIKNEYDVNLKTGFKTNLNEFSVKNPIGFPLRLLVLKCEVKWSSFVRWPCERKKKKRETSRGRQTNVDLLRLTKSFLKKTSLRIKFSIKSSAFPD